MTPETTHASVPKTTPRDFFFHLFSMFLLYVTVVSYILAVNDIVDIKIPDTLNLNGYTGDNSYLLTSLRNELSFLIVMVPAYIATAVALRKEFAKHNEKRLLRIRRWLVYLTIFVSAVTVVFSLVYVVNSLLNGELTLRFGLKAANIVAVASIIFAFFLTDSRKHSLE